GYWNYQSRDNRCSPVAQKDHQDDGGQNQAQQNGVAHASDGIANDDGLVIEGLDLNSGRERLANLGDLAVDFIRNLDRVAVGLAVDVEQHGRFAVGRDQRIYRLDSGSDGGDVADAHGNSRGRVPDDRVGDLLRRSHLAAHQRQHQLMIAFEESGGIDEVGTLHRIQDVGDGDVRGQQFRRVGRDVEFRLLSALHQNCGHAVQPVQSRLDVVGGHLPELGLRNGRRSQAVPNDGKAGEGHAIRDHAGGRRQVRLDARQGGVYVLQGENRVNVPVEEQIDLGGAAAGDRAHLLQSGNAVHGFLDGTGDGHHHLIGGHDSVVHRDQDAGKVGGGEDCHRNAESQEATDQC